MDAPVLQGCLERRHQPTSSSRLIAAAAIFEKSARADTMLVTRGIHGTYLDDE